MSAVWRAVGAASQPLLGATSDLLKFAKPAPKPVLFPQGGPPEPCCKPAPAGHRATFEVTASAGFAPHAPATAAELEGTLTRLHSKRAAWASLPPDARAALLRTTLACTIKVPVAYVAVPPHASD